jgi:Mg2+-importing ATPase
VTAPSSLAAPSEPGEDWAARPAAEVLAALGSSPSGLPDADAEDIRARVGPNSLAAHRVSAWRVLGRQFRNAVLVLLLITTVIAAALGDTTDAAIILVILVASVGLGFFDEYRAERTTARLRDALGHTAVVVRGGSARVVPLDALVPGDVVELTMGALVPADVRILVSHDLECDESLLTGESAPVTKTAEPVQARSIADRASMAYMGTTVAAGAGTAVVTSTGHGTELGRMAASLDTAAPETAFQAGLRHFSVLLMIVGAVLVVSIVVTGVLLHRSLLESMLFALAIAVGITPQLLPAVVTTSLSAGARRLARQHVLVKRLVCIEDLGNIDVLVTDKTGTLTDGRIDFERSIGPDGADRPDLVVLAAAMTPDAAGGGSTGALDTALVRAASRILLAAALPALVDATPFDHERRTAAALLAAASGRLLVVKGAPEAVLARCAEVPPEAADTLAELLHHGARVLAVGSAPTTATRCADTEGLTLRLEGFLAFTDPPRTDAAASLARLHDLGVRVVIATGDHPLVAQTVADALGLVDGGTLTGDDLDRIDDASLPAALADTRILARVTPQQKARAVRVLRKEGRTIGFLGDGVNDSLALHEADVGISVDSATDVAKNAADVILLEKDLGVIAAGIAEGRRIFANTIKYVFMAASSNFGNMISAAAASAFLPFLPMLPSQILLSNLLYDASQLSIATDRVDAAAVRAPSRWDMGAVRRFMLVFGPLSSAFDLAMFAMLLGVFHADATLFHSGWFVEALVTQALVVLVIRTRVTPFFRSRPSTPLLLSLLAVVTTAVLLPYSPLAPVLGLEPLPVTLLATIALVVVLYLVVAEIAKWALFRADEAHRRPLHRRRRLIRSAARFGLAARP